MSRRFVAFFYVLRDLTHYDGLIHKHADGVSRDDLMREVRCLALIRMTNECSLTLLVRPSIQARGGASFEVTPLEIDFLFKMFADPNDGRIYARNYDRLLGTTISAEMNMCAHTHSLHGSFAL